MKRARAKLTDMTYRGSHASPILHAMAFSNMRCASPRTRRVDQKLHGQKFCSSTELQVKCCRHSAAPQELE